MNGFFALVLTLVAGAGWLTVVTREPVRQAMLAGILALLLALLFFAVQAPDVALSEIVVGSAAIPLMLLLAIAKIREEQAQQQDGDASSGGGDEGQES